MHQHIKKLGSACFAATIATAMLITAPATADSIKRNGFQIDSITLIGVENGKIKYRTGGGENTAPLSEIELIGVDAAPELEAGQKLLAEGQLRKAQRSFEAVWSKSRVPWIKHYAGYFLLQVYDKRDEPVDAATVFAQLASENADVYFMSKPPVASLEKADADQKKRISEKILSVAETARGERRRLVNNYLKQVTGEGGPSLDPETDNGTSDDPQDKAAARANAKIMVPTSLWALADRDGEAKGKWDSIDLLSKGEYQAVLDDIKPRMNGKGDIAPKLFIYAKATLGLADASKDKKLYRDAGLAFMRIVVHFNRPGQQHPLVVPAQLEVAYLHQKIGRQDIFDRILFGTGGNGGLNLLLEDAKEYPLYHKRYYEVIGEDPPAPEEDQP